MARKTLAVASLWLAAACASDNDGDNGGSSRASAGGARASAADGGGGAGEPGRVDDDTAGARGLLAPASGSAGTSAATGGSSGGARSGGSSAEVCDGVDNDGNGIIDDVDAEMDGVCDCLNIATIGAIGPWSNGGNVFKEWLDARSPRPAVELGDQVITEALLAPYQVIIVLDVATFEISGMGRTVAPHHVFSADEAEALQRWVEQGGGLMSTIGYSTDEQREIENVNRLLAPLSLGYVTMNQELNGYVESWTQHPVTEGVMRIFIDNGIPPVTDIGMSLARDSGGHLALQVAEIGTGHAVVWGDEWITYDSQWQDVQDQQVERFWLNIFKWLSPTKVCQVPTPQ